MGFGADFTFTLLTNDPKIAGAGDFAGVDRIGLDLEKLNKNSRQGHVGNVMISDHCLAELPAIREKLKNADLFVRVDPINPASREQIDWLISEGVAVLMLPMFRRVEEVVEFVKLVDGRARTVLLAETTAAIFRIAEIAALPGVDEIHVGLNDLRLDAKIANHFEIVASVIMEKISEVVRGADLAFGFGGVARVDDQNLPVPPDLIYAQYARLRATSALLTRSFIPAEPNPENFTTEMAKARARLDYWWDQKAPLLEEQRQALAHSVARVEL